MSERITTTEVRKAPTVSAEQAWREGWDACEQSAADALDRAGTKVINTLFRTEHRKDVRVGMYEAVAKMKDVQL